MTCDATSYTIRTEVRARLDGVEVFREELSDQVPRDHT